MSFVATTVELTIRLTERDKVKIGECFRLGDIVKAKVVSKSAAAMRGYILPSQSRSPGPYLSAWHLVIDA